ncbi:MAG TPA: hypothetical protein VGQ85_03320 [Candidatus Limnocylindrales bacterium]|nr:hypothetical protein [Candidatus Limnocylindrales bacterium]
MAGAQSQTRLPWRIGKFGAIPVLCVLLGACGIGGLVEVEPNRVVNHSSQTLSIFRVEECRPDLLIAILPPGLQQPTYVSGEKECTVITLVARISSGQEFARRTGPFCPNDQWVIVDPAP